MQPINDAVSETQLKELLLHEERKSERYANYARLLLTFLYFAVGLGIRQELPVHSFNAIISASLINLIYGIFVFFKLKDPNPPSWIKYPSVSIDILLLSIVIYSFGTFRTFKTEAFLLYFLWIGLSTLRFSPILTLVSGLLSIGAYLLIFALAIHDQTIVLGTITEEFVSERVSNVNIILKLVFLSAFVVLAVYIARVFRLIASKALTKQILQAQNAELNNALDRLRETQKQLAQKNRELATLSEIDALTQLYNRRKIDQIIEEYLVETSHRPFPLAMIILDIDRFKHYNDHYGHQAGDDVIRGVAHALATSARGNDSIGRWGGEEFIIICRDTDSDTALKIAERLRTTIEQAQFQVDEPVTCSFGVTSYRVGDNADSLIKRADDALYTSKQLGRNRVSHK
ncbi:MAG: GGDEF domain-containing protein [Candidatus Thiodiazotropha endolucinida]